MTNSIQATFMSGHFDVLVDFCVSGSRRNWKKAKSTGTVTVIATEQRPSFPRSELHGMRTAYIFRPISFDHQAGQPENH